MKSLGFKLTSFYFLFFFGLFRLYCYSSTVTVLKCKLVIDTVSSGIRLSSINKNRILTKFCPRMFNGC